MELLRKGDKASEDALVEKVFGFFHFFVRAIYRYANGRIDPSECQDVAVDFIVYRFPKLMRTYGDCDANGFSGVFYKALKNFALDWARRICTVPTGPGRGVPLDGLENLLPSANQFESELRPAEYAHLLADIRDAMWRYVGGDIMKAWILEASLMAETKADEVERKIPELFPGKVFASGSVYSLVSRFRKSQELAMVARKWAEDLGLKKRLAN